MLQGDGSYVRLQPGKGEKRVSAQETFLELLAAEVREVDLASLGLVGVAPSKGHFNRSVDPESVPWEFDPRIYGTALRFPADDAWVDPPFIAGPLRGQALRVPVARRQAWRCKVCCTNPWPKPARSATPLPAAGTTRQSSPWK